MRQTLKIEFVSDVVCPWCAIGFSALQQAISNVSEVLSIDLYMQPFELNPDMPGVGEEVVQHIQRKYGSSAAEIARNQAKISIIGESAGFQFDLRKRSHFYNSHASHRLLCWAEENGRQIPLAKALFEAYFTHGKDISDHIQLADIAVSIGFDKRQTLEILASDAYADDVLRREDFYLNHGINSVPAMIINGRHLISGAQSVEHYTEALLSFARATRAEDRFHTV